MLDHRFAETTCCNYIAYYFSNMFQAGSLNDILTKKGTSEHLGFNQRSERRGDWGGNFPDDQQQNGKIGAWSWAGNQKGKNMSFPFGGRTGKGNVNGLVRRFTDDSNIGGVADSE